MEWGNKKKRKELNKIEKPRKTKNGSTHRHRKLDDIKEAYNKTKRNQNKIYKAMSNEK